VPLGGKGPGLRLRLFGDDFGAVSAIQVFDERTRRVTQRLVVPEVDTAETEHTTGHDDLDFDGFPDLRVVQFRGANNWADFLWILDPVRRRYVYCRRLSEETKVIPDPARRIVDT